MSTNKLTYTESVMDMETMANQYQSISKPDSPAISSGFSIKAS